MSTYDTTTANINNLDVTTPTEGASPPSEMNNSDREIKYALRNMWKITTTSGNLTLDKTHGVIYGNGAHTVTLPQISTVASTATKFYYIVNKHASSALTIKTYSSETLDGVDRSSTGISLPARMSMLVATDASGWYTLGNNGIVQQVSTVDGAVNTGTTVMPLDDTIPQKTEGDEYMTLAITPQNTNNKLVITVSVALASHSSATSGLGVALFQDTTANALAAGLLPRDNSANSGGGLSYTYVMAAGTTSSTTFKVRIGSPNAGTTTFNGGAGARLFGGVSSSSIVIQEVKG
jgi:hypothetical protein